MGSENKGFLVQENDFSLDSKLLRTKARMRRDIPDVADDKMREETKKTSPGKMHLSSNDMIPYMGNHFYVLYGYRDNDMILQFYENDVSGDPFPEDTGSKILELIRSSAGKSTKAKTELVDDEAIGGKTWFTKIVNIRLRPALLPRLLDGLILGLDNWWSELKKGT